MDNEFLEIILTYFESSEVENADFYGNNMLSYLKKYLVRVT